MTEPRIRDIERVTAAELATPRASTYVGYTRLPGASGRRADVWVHPVDADLGARLISGINAIPTHRQEGCGR